MTVYHGSSVIVKKPDITHSYRTLDFGNGFYVTTGREQAVQWAKRKQNISGSERAILNIYHMDAPTDDFKIKNFDEDLMEWIDFVCRCRDGYTDYLKYDLIYGKVANDKVFRVVDLYHKGIWDKERALKEIKIYPSYDQLAFITQKAIDKLLVFQTFEEV